MTKRALEAERFREVPDTTGGPGAPLREVASVSTEETPSSSRVRVGSGEPVTQGSKRDGELQASGAAVAALATTILGEVLDTHHPIMPGRVMVAWVGADGQRMERWLECERHLSLRTGDRVLLSLLGGLNEWVVTGALGRVPGPAPRDPNSEQQLRLQPGESVCIVAHDGQPLLTLRQGPTGPVIELGAGDVELKAERTLRLSAEAIELTADKDIELRSERDTVVRGRYIRLN